MQDISIIPTACNENYAIKDQYYLDGVKKYRHFPSKLKKKSLFTHFTDSLVLSTKDDQEQKTETERKKNREIRKTKSRNKEK